MFVDVILPLPLEGLFTYSVPGDLADEIKPGMRVLVTLGRSKSYTAVVAEVHDRKPDFETKEINGLPDQQQMVLDTQLRLWRWIADYYMSPIGEVYHAAMPAGLKEDSFRPKYETCITLSPKFRNEQALHIAVQVQKYGVFHIQSLAVMNDRSSSRHPPVLFRIQSLNRLDV